NLAEGMTVGLVMTKRADLVCVDRRGSVSEAQTRMQKGGYDQLPITDNGHVVGLVRKRDLVTSDGATPLASLCLTIDSLSLSVRETIHAVIRRLQDDEAVLVIDDEKECTGLVHYSDLNRQAARLFLYLWLSGLEMGLAELVLRWGPKFD